MSTIQIRDFAKVKGGKRLSGGYFVQEKKTDHPYIRVTDMELGMLSTSNIKYLPDGAYENIKKYTISSDDVYISIAGTIGLVGKIPNQLSGANLTENAAKITELDKSQINQDYLIYFLRSRHGQFQINARVGGSTQPKLALNRIETIEVPLRSIGVQNRIASVLTTYDELIQNNKKRVKNLEEMAQRQYTEWFVKFKFPGHKKVKMVDSGTDYGMIPENWVVTELGSQIQIKKGKNITKNTISEGTVPVIAGGIEPAYYHNKANTISPVVTISASGANAGYINLFFVDVWASDSSFIDKGITQNVFFYYLFLKKNHRIIDNLKRGAAQPHVYPKDLMSVKMVTPTESILIEFNSIISPIFGLIGKLKLEIEKLTRMRDLLIPQLVTGRRAVQ